jgi:hypothetical protein
MVSWLKPLNSFMFTMIAERGVVGRTEEGSSAWEVKKSRRYSAYLS